MLALRLFSTQPPKTSFVSVLLDHPLIDNHLKEIYTHAFNQELFSGTLNPRSFGQYLRDDDYYLQHYANIIGGLAHKIRKQNTELAKNLSYLSIVIISGEQEMQAQYSEHLLNKSSHKPGKAISSYVEFLKINAKKDLPIALISVLPCFWIYYQLGVKLKSIQQLDANPYQEWIKTYSSKEFVEATIQLKEFIDQLADEASPQMQREMQEVFDRAVRHELKFFDAIYPVKEKHKSNLLCCF